ncbi:MAG TPA: replication-associated recombination protein A, partial [Bacillota bacterium]
MEQQGLFGDRDETAEPGAATEATPTAAGQAAGRAAPDPAGADGSADAPLAFRLRPRSFDEFVGQRHLLAPGRPLRQAIENDQLTSMIFYGPPGSGKTALAGLIARRTKAAFERLNAVTAGVADLRRVIERAERRRAAGQRTVLFVDEIHRFNKAQQDALLPAVEQGAVVLIGATTENPFFSVNAPLISRSRVFAFEPLSEDDIATLLDRAVCDGERGLGRLKVVLEPEARAHLARAANGDARAALNALELAALSTPPGPDGSRRVTAQAAAEAMQRPVLHYDGDGDAHYDTISAFIKSMRGSDPDATLYWLARMLEAGEDARFIARRIVIHASEDVGLADPQALVVAVAAAQAVELVGLPE